MNDFDAKWQACAARARQSMPSQDDAAPPGFATRVVARGLEQSRAIPAGVWERMAVRSFAGVLALLTICAAFELPHFRDQRPLDPGIGNTVAQLIWSL